jgi:exopolysaccharide biosynthesis polyprenyl glycosylphosphotransferase
VTDATLAPPLREDEPYAHLDERARRLLERRALRGRRRGSLVRRALAVADVVALSLAFVVAAALSSIWAAEGHDPLTWHAEALLFLPSLPAWIVVAKIYGLYDRDEERTDHSTADEFVGVFHVVTIGAWLLYSVATAVDAADPSFARFFVFWALAIVLICACRAVARAHCRQDVAYLQNTIIVGAGEVGQLLARKYLLHPEYGINLVGLVDASPLELRPELEHLALLGPPTDLPELIATFDVERVVIAFSLDPHADTLALLRGLSGLDVQIDIVPRLFEFVGPAASVHEIEGIPVVGLPPLRLSWSSLFLKRALDIALGTIALVLTLPLLAVIALAVRAEGSGPVLYGSERLGRRGKRFMLLKFRTMSTEHCRGSRYGAAGADSAFEQLMRDPARHEEFERTHKLTDDPRVTRVGRILRRTSLDELPQLLNVLRGEISLVGPRPVTVDEHIGFRSAEADALGYWASSNLRPGVTGYWQINGRSRTDYADRLRLDLAYVTNWSIGLDLIILAKTARALVGGRGAY